ncbi:ABC transporter permease [Cellulomonas denverensis]|uniref:ABC transporter permease n=1 Tax=Cellulomonas denverensis TaxID=264297 RepID=A0A7X6KXG2_9CELL|nr:ABC transporter permease [Cellulomonas denverensis]NKY24001.1 ABC transporter permease [Cellulomonas denverensis]GIG27255.1 ABC transporter permease [Cellulomonas denverensis]
MTAPAALTGEVVAPSGWRAIAARIDWRRDIIYVGFVLVFCVFALLLGDQGFLSSTNLLNILRQTAIVAIMAVGMTFVIAAAEIDLSVGSVAGLSSITTAITISHAGLVPGIVAGLAVGLLVGAINGALVAYVRIPSFLVTLAMLGIAVGVAQWVTASAPQPILDSTFNTVFGSGNIGPLPGLVVWMAIVVAIGAVVLRKTRFGRRVLATGANRVAAEYSGVNTARITFRVMLICSMTAALAGMLYAGRLHSGRFQWGSGDEMNAIAAVILGGTALSGGKGSVIGTLFGALLMALISNGLILAGLDSSQQQVVRGVIIVLAVALARKK